MVEYLIPKTKKELLKYINQHKSRMISGGTDLMVQRRNWAEVEAKFEECPVYIFNLNELKYIEEKNGKLHIGGTTPVSDILKHEHTPPLLKSSIEIMAAPALRNLATLPGNIVNASPAGDTLPVLIALNATVMIESVKGKKEVLVKDVITGVRKTILKDNEMITEIIVPLTTFTNESFVKVGGRKADAISKLSFTGAAIVEDGVIKDLRIALGAIAPVIVRNEEIEKKYIGLTKEDILGYIEDIINEYKPLVTPIDDQRSNKEYRKEVTLKLIKDFILNL
jgi:CO/xanthine dehydrogenase FAD-binding subunit